MVVFQIIPVEKTATSSQNGKQTCLLKGVTSEEKGNTDMNYVVSGFSQIQIAISLQKISLCTTQRLDRNCLLDGLFRCPKMDIGHRTACAEIFIGAREHCESQITFQDPALRQRVLTDQFFVNQDIDRCVIDNEREVCLYRMVKWIIKLHSSGTTSESYIP